MTSGGRFETWRAAGCPRWVARSAEASVCLYTNTPDQHFLIDRHPADAAVLVASPCSGHGFKFAPAIGELLADLLLDQPIRVDAAPFQASRFARP